MSSTDDYLEDHSLAKAEFIRAYATVYLNILDRDQSGRHIVIADLLCGEGVYKDGRKGTAVQLAEALVDFYYAGQAAGYGTAKIDLYLNDLGPSEVEQGRSKIERVKEAIASLASRLKEQPLNLHFSQRDAVQLASDIASSVGADRRIKKLIIADPKGWSQFPFAEAVRAISMEGAEVLLFLPLAHIGRFSFGNDIVPSMAELVETLWPDGDGPTHFESLYLFQKRFVEQARRIVGPSVHVTPIRFGKTDQHYHVLLHFTKSLVGLEKIVDALWQLDAIAGVGHTSNTQSLGSLFGSHGGQAHDPFSDALLKYISDNPGGRTNREITQFTLTSARRITHAVSVLKRGKKKGIFEIVSNDDQPPRSFYLGTKSMRKRSVTVRKRA